MLFNVVDDESRALRCPRRRPSIWLSGRVRDTTPKVRKTPFQSISIRMRFIDVFTLILSFLGVYGIVYSLRLLLPRNIVSLVSTSLNEAMALLGHAEAINIPNMNDY